PVAAAAARPFTAGILRVPREAGRLCCGVAPAVSIVVPTRDRRVLLGALLDALQADAAADRELIVGDDGSRDGTADDLARPAATGRRAHVGPPGVGLAAARNAGLARARADVVAFTDDDCVIPPRWSAALAGRLDASEAVAVGGRVVAAAGASRPARLS